DRDLFGSLYAWQHPEGPHRVGSGGDDRSGGLLVSRLAQISLASAVVGRNGGHRPGQSVHDVLGREGGGQTSTRQQRRGARQDRGDRYSKLRQLPAVSR